MRRRVSLLLIAVAVALGHGAAFADDPEPGVAQAIATQNTFVPGSTLTESPEPLLPVSTLVVIEGGRLQFSNLDLIVAHDLTDEGCRTTFDEVPCRFAAPEVNRRDGAVEVDGVSTLPPGSYPFYCSLHPSVMFGTLTIQEAL